MRDPKIEVSRGLEELAAMMKIVSTQMMRIDEESYQDHGKEMNEMAEVAFIWSEIIKDEVEAE